MLYDYLEEIQTALLAMTGYSNKPVDIGFKNQVSAENMPHRIIQIEDGSGAAWNLNVNRVHVLAFYFDQDELQETVLDGMEAHIKQLRDNCAFLSKNFDWIISPTLPQILGFEQKLLPPVGGFDLIYTMSGRYETS